MEQLLFIISNPLNKILLLLGSGVIGLSALMIHFLTKLKGSFKPYQKATLLYLLFFLVLFSFIGVTTHPSISTNPESFFIIYQVCFLFAGVLHYKLMHHYLQWSGDEKSFWLELLFTFIVGSLGCIIFLLAYDLFNAYGLAYIMAGSSLLFIVPFFFFQSFEKAISIPPKIRRQWFYPVHEEVEEPDEKKLKNLLIISFEFKKQNSDPYYTNFRAKAPADMEFGQLFYYFINDYNERYSNNKIQFIDGSGEPHGWTFHKKSKWYSFFTNYIDTEKTIYHNRIRENEVIICSRSLS